MVVIVAAGGRPDQFSGSPPKDPCLNDALSPLHWFYDDIGIDVL